MERVVLGVACAFVLVGVGCADDRTANTMGVACGETRCTTGQVCCIDCDGRGLCGPPGTACAGLACTADAGMGMGVSCGGTTCEAGQVCCLDCDGSGVCGAPGTACAGNMCEPTTCGGTSCAAGARCCTGCSGELFCSSGPSCPDTTCTCGAIGQSCCDPAPGDGPNYCNTGCCGADNMCEACDSTGCGALGEACCAPGADAQRCTDSLECCVGVPYPEEGRCETACTAVSDRNMKEGFAPVSTAEVLDRLRVLPVTRWSYRGEDTVHMGPMAQDFSAAFSLGDSDRHIHMVDANGVLVAAAQELADQLETSRTETAELRRQLVQLQRRLDQLEASR